MKPRMRRVLRKSSFGNFSRQIARATGQPAAFLAAFAIVVIWAAVGPIFGYSDTWQLVINTGTTIITFLMVFLIQNTQNRDSVAMQIKLDELIRSIDRAHNALLNLEELEEADLERIRADYVELAKQSRDDLRGTGAKPSRKSISQTIARKESNKTINP